MSATTIMGPIQKDDKVRIKADAAIPENVGKIGTVVRVTKFRYPSIIVQFTPGGVTWSYTAEEVEKVL